MDTRRKNDLVMSLVKILLELQKRSPSEILDLPGWELMHTSAILEEAIEVVRVLNKIKRLEQLPPVPINNELDYQKHCQDVLMNNPYHIVYYIPQDDDRSLPTSFFD